MALSLKRVTRYAPREPRQAVEIETTLLKPNDEVAQLSIRNISPDGFMGWSAAPVEVGEWIGVEMPDGGILPAQVRWVGEDEIGARFRHPLDLERLQKSGGSKSGYRSLFLSRLIRGWF